MENVAVTLDRFTQYPGGLFDDRPTTAYPGIEPHGNPGFSIRYADNVVLKHCSVKWGDKRPDYFTHALEAEAMTGLELTGFAERPRIRTGTRTLWSSNAGDLVAGGFLRRQSHRRQDRRRYMPVTLRQSCSFTTLPSAVLMCVLAKVQWSAYWIAPADLASMSRFLNSKFASGESL